MAPHRGFKYNVVKLLNAIRERPVLWDRTLEIYKDKAERKSAWDEIYNMLEEGYEEMSWEEKKVTGEHIVNKWTNIRDTFVKSLKNKLGKPKKKYLLYDHLKFLIKIIPEDEIAEGYNSSEESEEPSFTMKEEQIDYQEVEATSSGLNTSITSKRKQKRADLNDEYIPKKTKTREKYKSQDSSQDSDYETYNAADIDFVEVDSKMESDPRVMNEDEAFFASLLPTIVRYNEDERLEFRIEVLAVMMKIKEKRKRRTSDLM